MADPKRIKKGLYWDRAWYLTHGCRPRSPACANCWAASGANMRQYNPHPEVAVRHLGIIDSKTKHFNGRVNLDRKALMTPLETKKPTVWAVWDELFYGDNADQVWCTRRGIDPFCVPSTFIEKAFAVMALAQHHTFLILTKRPARMSKVLGDDSFRYAVEYIAVLNAFWIGVDLPKSSFCEDRNIKWPLPNVWCGTTIERPMFCYRGEYLRRTPAAGRFISFEPLLASFSDYPGVLDDIDVAIAGCESGHHRRETEIGWLRDLRDQCVNAGVPFFLKQMEKNGKVAKLPELDGRKWSDLPW